MNPISNFHTHTQLCNHAEGTPLDYVEQAIREGCTQLGFSDHCPYPDSFDDCWPNIRMAIDEVPTYLEWIEEAKEAAPFPVYTGYECEWDSDFSAWYSDDLKSTYKADYLVLGPHWVTDGSSHIYAPDIDNPTLLNKYIDQTIDGMRSGNFAFVAHPDLFMAGYKEWDEQSKACLQAILDAACDLDLPLEINGLGITRTPSDTRRGIRYAYPYCEFWEMVSRSNARVICNSDAHHPSDVIFNAWKARDFASRFCLTPIEKPDF